MCKSRNVRTSARNIIIQFWVVDAVKEEITFFPVRMMCLLLVLFICSIRCFTHFFPFRLPLERWPLDLVIARVDGVILFLI